ncbi:phage holin family protein [Gemmatimonas groenlandica]|uniref:Phage holin family protein n=1 Tax=Gemmatimonas groenlandica TaxID=2732249 RepID=A0A6M4IJX8_9BACT|nr:phage holin family protein [Gemmatimonas groenlandica]QJR34159.1 phage holin family protein [Gemmatimonas groenlandica]
MRNDDFEVRLDRQREGSLPLIDVRVNDRQDAPLGTLLKQLTGDTADLLRQELALAKSEAREAGTRLMRDAAKVGIAAGLTLMGGLALTTSLIVGLGVLLSGNYWLSALIVGVAAFGAGYSMVQSALRDLSDHGFAPKEAIASLKADQRWASREVQDLKHELTDKSDPPHVRP